jgi:hypothetical protein
MKRLSLKSGIMALAISLISASAFAIDVGASVNMAGNLWGTQGFVINNQNQKDADLLRFFVNTDNAGAEFKLWSDLSGDSSTVHLRAASLWFKPISMVKVAVGNIGSYLYTEQISWWKVPCGAALSDANGWNHRWSSYAGVEGGGVNVEFTPIDGLFLAAGIAPGFGNTLLAYDAADGSLAAGANTDYGFVAKYNISGIGSIGAGFRDEGDAAVKLVRVGFDVNAVSGLYAFEDVIMNFDGDFAFQGMSFDTYAAYSVGAFSVKFHPTVTIRTTGVAGDDSWMTYDFKASYKVLDNVTPYLRISQDGDNSSAFGTSLTDFNFAPSIGLGAEYSVGKVSLDTAVRVILPATAADDVTWAIPFTARLSF